MVLISKNTLHKTEIHLDASEKAFVLNGELIHFDEVKAFFQRFTENYINNVYQDKTLEVEIRFHSRREPFKAEVGTSHIEDYASLYQLAHHLSQYRQQQLEQKRQQGDPLTFPERLGRYSLLLTGSQLSVCDSRKSEDPAKGCWEVKQATLQESELRFKGTEGQKIRFAAQSFGDSPTLLTLLATQPWFLNANLQPRNNNIGLFLAIVAGSVALAINGWFALCCQDNLWIALPSLLAQIMVPLILIIGFLHWIWLAPLERKRKRREMEREALVEAGQLPHIEQPGWLKKWSWLWITIGSFALIMGMALSVVGWVNHAPFQ